MLLCKISYWKFYLLIMEKTVDEALNMARECILIPEDKINIFKHCHKLLLYLNEDLWIKKGSCNFNNLISSFDGAQLCKLIGCLLLCNLSNIIDSCNHGLHQDYVLIIVDDCTPRTGNMIRKKLHWLFNKFGFKLDIQTNLKITCIMEPCPHLRKTTNAHIILM